MKKHSDVERANQKLAETNKNKNVDEIPNRIFGNLEKAAMDYRKSIRSKQIDHEKLRQLIAFVKKRVEQRKTSVLLPLATINDFLGCKYQTSNYFAYMLKSKYKIREEFGVTCGIGHHPEDTDGQYVYFDMVKP